MKKVVKKAKMFSKPMFRIHLYENQGADWKGRLSLTDDRHKIIRNLSHPFASLDNIPRAMRALLKKAESTTSTKGKAKKSLNDT